MQFTVSDWPIKPMEPVSVDEAFDDADMFFQVKWDGVRVLTYVYPDGKVRLFNRRLNERTQQYPEIVEIMSKLPNGTVLDGEIIAFGFGGKPDFPRVLQRDFLRSPVKIKTLAGIVQVHYMVFDVIWHKGKPVYDRPLVERLQILGEDDFNSPLAHKVESIPEKGKALFEAVKFEGLEGIVAKKTDSPYRIAKKTDLWKKIKCFRNVTGLIGGYLQEDPVRIKSLLIGLEEPEGLRYIGTAASGITQKEWQLLKNYFTKIPGNCPFANPPAGVNLHFVQPVLSVEVRFLEYTAEGVMRAPSVIAFPKGLS